MENLDIKATATTPQIRFNAGTGKLRIKGRSIPEDPGVFYQPVFEWLEKYFSQGGRAADLEFGLEYVNSGSSKYMLELLREVEKYIRKGNQVKITWCYEQDDESMEELGDHYHNTLNLDITMREIEEIELEDES
jgi:hypothetical protein